MKKNIEYRVINDKEEWNSSPKNFSLDTSYMFSWEWGEIKKKSGWGLTRLQIIKNNQSLFIQILHKQFFFIKLLYIQHIPIGNLENFNVQEIINFFKKYKNFKIFYLRTSIIENINQNFLFDINSFGLNKVFYQGNTNLTLICNTDILNEDWLKNLNRNRKRAYKNFIKNQGDCKYDYLSNFDIDEIKIFFEKFKKYKNQNVYMSDRILELREILGDNIVIFYIKVNNIITSLRACLIYKENAYDFWAASMPRNYEYASEIILFKMLFYLKNNGIKLFEFGGVDPKNNKGVYDFKRSFNFQKSIKVGEWSFCNFPLRLIFDFIIGRKMH